MKCPICTIDLVMSEKKGIEIDYCPKCRGVWLDRGELDKIIERSATELQTQYSQEKRIVKGGQEQQAQDYYRKPRRKSFLEELFD